MNIRTNYLALVLAIQKDWKNKTTKLTKVILQIIRHFKFIKRNKKVYNIIQISCSTISINHAPKSFCINPKYIEKRLTTHYINYY